jgi:hypothetical protein
MVIFTWFCRRLLLFEGHCATYLREVAPSK